MMRFRTEIENTAGRFMINPDLPITFLGSCFASNIADRFSKSLCRDVTANPTGMLFNPRSICNVMECALRLAEDSSLIADLTFEHDGYFGNFLADTSFLTSTRQECERRVISRLMHLRESLQRAATLVVTLGTAWTYCIEGGYVVSNCNKLPSAMFTRRRLSVSECYNCLKEIRHAVCGINPDHRMIITVSPVRHVKDGLHGNCVSKSILHVTADMFVNDFPEVDYFPAYEILTDDLRDYRFYAQDLAHPSEQAVEYIWQKFQETYFTQESRRRITRGESLFRRQNHRHLHPDSPEALAFDQETKRLVETFAAERIQ